MIKAKNENITSSSSPWSGRIEFPMVYYRLFKFCKRFAGGWGNCVKTPQWINIKINIALVKHKLKITLKTL